ncbi:MAG: RluA family pseudouridine synthase [Paludibacteraceae bacterium]
MEVIYEDNHIIAVNKACGEIVQGDKTGDTPLSDTVKAYIKEKYQKPGDVFLGVTHRLDRPTSGVVLFARTSKALARLNDMFKSHEQIRKTYWAITQNAPVPSEGRLENYLLRNEKQNKSYVVKPDTPEAKRAVLTYRTIAQGERYTLVEVNLETGRHHQIRCQLAAIGCPIKGDLKYGARRSNPDGGISLHARQVEFVHPVSKQPVVITAEVPDDNLWHALEENIPTDLKNNT